MISQTNPNPDPNHAPLPIEKCYLITHPETAALVTELLAYGKSLQQSRYTEATLHLDYIAKWLLREQHFLLHITALQGENPQ